MLPVWQAGPVWSTSTRSVSASQSARTSRTRCRHPEVSPFFQSFWRERLQNTVYPVFRVSSSDSRFIQATMRTSCVVASCTTAG